MINRVVLVGRLTKDPELKYTQGGVAVTRFTLAVNRTFTNQQGQREADFVNCVTWRKQAENTANYLRKGSLAGIEGRIQTSNFEGKDGNRVFMTEVVADSVQFLEPRSANAERGGGGGFDPSYQNQGQFQGAPSQGQGNYQQQPSYQSNQQPSQQNYTNMNDDPFATNSGPIEVSDDDLPF